MRFSTGIIAAFAAVVSVAFAASNPISKPTAGDTISAGTPFNIVWQPTTSGDITLTLRKGASTDLKDVAVITSNTANSGSFKWTPSSDLVSGDNYAIQITDASGGVNFTPEFSVSSSATSSSSSASSSASSTSSASKSKTESASTTSSEKSSSTEKATKTTVTTTSANSTTTHHATITATSNHTHHNATTLHPKTTSLKGNLTSTVKPQPSASASSTGSGSSSSATAPSGTGAPNSAANALLKSPLALVLCVIGAIMYLN